jgi:hypothetical protein
MGMLGKQNRPREELGKERHMPSEAGVPHMHKGIHRPAVTHQLRRSPVMLMLLRLKRRRLDASRAADAARTLLQPVTAQAGVGAADPDDCRRCSPRGAGHG